MAKCLIIGGGFVGAHLASHLSARDHEVTVYSRSFAAPLVPSSAGQCGEIALVDGIVPPGRRLGDLIDRADVVFYLAGGSTPAAAGVDPGGSMLAHVGPAAAVLDVMRDTSTRRLVIASSGGTIYGAATVHPTPESYPPLPASLHGLHSLMIERYVEYFASHHGFETVVLRLANPYGPRQRAHKGQGVIAAWSEALLRDEPILIYGDPGTRRDFIFIDDVVSAFALAGLEAAPGIYNIGSGVASELREVIAILRAVSGNAGHVIELEGRGVDLPITQLDSSRFTTETAWAPTVGLTEGIEVTWKWASAHFAVT